jgi:hypothetical protein
LYKTIGELGLRIIESDKVEKEIELLIEKKYA